MLQVNRTAVRPATRGSVNRAFSTPRLSVRAAAHTKQQAAGARGCQAVSRNLADQCQCLTICMKCFGWCWLCRMILLSCVHKLTRTPACISSASLCSCWPAEPSPGLPLAWAGVLLSSTPLAAWADEAAAPVEAAAESVQQAAAAATEAAAEVAPTPTWLSYIGRCSCGVVTEQT